MIQSPVNTYRQEVLEHLNDIEETILDLEENPGNKEYMNRLFRSIHTIKGSGSMFGFNDIVGFTHHLE
ncbi:Hpt domain-containing protein, partial [Desulfobacterales bacterium HSG17]|nr:Hpt domain-containing protein [Desulfobacterales bacterium HSG17]